MEEYFIKKKIESLAATVHNFRLQRDKLNHLEKIDQLANLNSLVALQQVKKHGKSSRRVC